jgi:cytochrome c
MKIRQLLILSAGLLISAHALADGEALAKQSGCMMCHKVDAKSPTAPAFKAIAEKYRGDAGAAARLEVKVRKGGSGSFGTNQMMATPSKVSDDDIKALVAWILSLK